MVAPFQTGWQKTGFLPSQLQVRGLPSREQQDNNISYAASRCPLQAKHEGPSFSSQPLQGRGSTLGKCRWASRDRDCFSLSSGVTVVLYQRRKTRKTWDYCTISHTHHMLSFGRWGVREKHAIVCPSNFIAKAQNLPVVRSRPWNSS